MYRLFSKRRGLAGFFLLFALLWQMPLYSQQPHNLPKEPLEFAPDPSRSNALDLLISPLSHFNFFLRYQRAVNLHFSLMFDVNLFVHYMNIVQLLPTLAQIVPINLDLRLGAGIGLAFWPWEKLRKGYVALRSQIQFQFFNASIGGAAFERRRFLVGSGLEIGGRVGRRVLSTGAFGGLGFQVVTDAATVLPERLKLQMIYLYFGFSFGLTFR